ncbi:MAG TPA: cell division protein ZapE, partial [Geminicoccaceae bacterium]|nr:cell division protein ZapE [Geminicoccaceae bacterium]
LQRLQDELAEVAAEPAPAAGGFLARLRRGRAAPRPAPRGVYIHGGVGRGKSMLMDLFFAEAPVARKRRVHFHEFMLEVQKRLHELRRNGGREDPLRQLAADIAAESRLLCFDEFHVVDIADAMILGRLFTGLFEEGVVVVATSNWTPDRLYEGGLQRELFLPFIALLEETLDVVALNSPTDYRLARLHDAPVYLHPLDAAAAERLEAIFAALTDGATGAPDEIRVGSRCLPVRRAAKGVAVFDFLDLCERPLGAADYLALSERYHSVILQGVPRLTPDKRTEARRFMTLVDAMYERRVVLVVSAEAPPERLYASGDGAFEFQRTVSRLMEMQSRDYIERCRDRRPAELPREFAPYALTSDLV